MSGAHYFFLALAGLGSALAGFLCLGLAMDRHWEQLHGRGTEPRPALKRWLHLGGIGGLVVSLLACIALRGAGQGWVAWAGMLTVAAVALALTFTYGTRGVARMGVGATAVALLALLAVLSTAAT
jgi:hypothetical protein